MSTTRRDCWLGIELRHFAALDAIAKERSFRGAASRLGYVQSAISRQVAHLEQLTGERLIERSHGPRPVHLTDAGQLLLAHANDILASIEAAKADFARVSDGRSGEVRLGMFPGVPTRVLPHALVAFGSRCPDARVTVTEAATDAPFFDLLQQGGVDLAFAYLPGETGPFELCEVLRVPWVLVVRADAELARRATPPTPAELSRVPLIAAISTRVGSSIEARLRSLSEPPRIVFRSDLAETAVALAAEGVGAAVLPRLAVDEKDPRTALIDLDDLLPPISIGLAWHRNRRLSGLVTEFREVVVRVCSGTPGQRFERGAVHERLLDRADAPPQRGE